MLDKAKVLGNQVSAAQATTASSQTSLSNKWLVNLTLNSKGTTAFGNLTSDMFSKYGTQAGTNPLDDLAVVLDGQIVSSPSINSRDPWRECPDQPLHPVPGPEPGQPLNYGALPVTFKQQNIESVSPQLGRTSSRRA